MRKYRSVERRTVGSVVRFMIPAQAESPGGDRYTDTGIDRSDIDRS